MNLIKRGTNLHHSLPEETGGVVEVNPLYFCALLLYLFPPLYSPELVPGD
jgi:hypothetical protein